MASMLWKRLGVVRGVLGDATVERFAGALDFFGTRIGADAGGRGGMAD